MHPCPACGTPNVPGSAQCARCGAALTGAPAQGSQAYGAQQPGYGAPQGAYGQPGAMAAPSSMGGPSAKLDVMDVVRTSAQLLQKKAGALIGLQAIGVVPGTLVIFAGVAMAMPSITPGQAPPTNPMDVFGDNLVPLVIAYAIGLILILGAIAVTYPASLHIGLETFRGRPEVSFGDGIAKGMKKAPTVLAVMGIVVLAELVIFAVLGGVVFALAQISSLVGTLVGVLLGFAVFIGIFVFVLQMTAFLPAIVAEDLDLGAAFRRSSELMSGSKFSMFLAYVVMVGAYVAVLIPLSCCIGAPINLMATAAVGPAGGLVSSVITLPVALGFSAWFHIAPVIAYARRSGWGSGVAAQDVAQVFR